jgi:hypothetical protein
MAVINGIVYSEGEALKSGDAAVGTITHIGLDRVELHVGNEKVAIAYPVDLPSMTSPAAQRVIASSDPVESRRAFAPMAATADDGRRPSPASIVPVAPAPPAKMN